MPFALATDPVHPISPGPWMLWAHKERDAPGNPVYRHVGVEQWTRLHGGHAPVVPVCVVADPEGRYWGWQDSCKDYDKPTMIWSAQLLLEICFSSGSDHAVEVMARVGHTGKIVRMNINERTLS